MSVNVNGTVYYYATNLQGDVVAILDANGNEVVSYTYDAWGVLLSTEGTLASTLGYYNPLRYRGYIYDEETGLYYLQSRYYKPDWGRFINADVYASTGQGILGANMFAYCNNNPVIFKDSTGTLLVSALIFIGAAVVVGAGTGAYISVCTGGEEGDIIEGAIEGALTGGAAAAIGFFAAPIVICGITVSAPIVSAVGGMFAGAFIDMGVQTTSHVIENGSLDDFELDVDRVIETSATTGLAAVVPTFNGTPKNIDMAIGSAIVGAEASVLISTAVIVRNRIRAMTLKEKLFHG